MRSAQRSRPPRPAMCTYIHPYCPPSHPCVVVCVSCGQSLLCPLITSLPSSPKCACVTPVTPLSLPACLCLAMPPRPWPQSDCARPITVTWNHLENLVTMDATTLPYRASQPASQPGQIDSTNRIIHRRVEQCLQSARPIFHSVSACISSQTVDRCIIMPSVYVGAWQSTADSKLLHHGLGGPPSYLAPSVSRLQLTCKHPPPIRQAHHAARRNLCCCTPIYSLLNRAAHYRELSLPLQFYPAVLPTLMAVYAVRRVRCGTRMRDTTAPLTVSSLGIYHAPSFPIRRTNRLPPSCQSLLEAICGIACFT